MYPLPLPDLDQLRQDGEVRRIAHGPSTISEVLGRASAAMDEQDRLEEMRRDPVAYMRAHRPRRNLWQRLMYGGRHGRN